MFSLKRAILPLMAASLVSVGAQAAGDLTTRPQELPDLILGDDVSDYSMSQKRYEMETGKAYSLKIISSGYKEYAIQAPEFFTSIFLRKVEAGDMEIKATTLTELEFEEASEAEIFFVPIKPGTYEFYSEGLENKGMVGEFVVE